MVGWFFDNQENLPSLAILFLLALFKKVGLIGGRSNKWVLPRLSYKIESQMPVATLYSSLEATFISKLLIDLDYA